MDPATVVEIVGLAIYCLLYTIILFFWVLSFARDLRLLEDSEGRQYIQGCCTINERSLPKLFYFFVLISLFGACRSSDAPQNSAAHLFLAARIVWLDLHLYGEKSQITFGINRLAFCTFFTAFTLVVFHWYDGPAADDAKYALADFDKLPFFALTPCRAEKYHSTYVASNRFLPTIGWAFVLTSAFSSK